MPTTSGGAALSLGAGLVSKRMDRAAADVSQRDFYAIASARRIFADIYRNAFLNRISRQTAAAYISNNLAQHKDRFKPYGLLRQNTGHVTFARQMFLSAYQTRSFTIMKTAVRAATFFTAVAATLIFTNQAKAATDIGVVSSYSTFDSQTENGPISDLFTFTVGSTSKGVFALTGIAFTPTEGVAFSSAQIYAGTYGDALSLDPTKLVASSNPELGTPIPNTSIVIHNAIGETSLNLSPDTTYTLYVTGTSGGQSSYTGIIALAPVPEPETYAMLLAGLGLMGSIARRRRKAADKRPLLAQHAS